MGREEYKLAAAAMQTAQRLHEFAIAGVAAGNIEMLEAVFEVGGAAGFVNPYCNAYSTLPTGYRDAYEAAAMNHNHEVFQWLLAHDISPVPTGDIPQSWYRRGRSIADMVPSLYAILFVAKEDVMLKAFLERGFIPHSCALSRESLNFRVDRRTGECFIDGTVGGLQDRLGRMGHSFETSAIRKVPYDELVKLDILDMGRNDLSLFELAAVLDHPLTLGSLIEKGERPSHSCVSLLMRLGREERIKWLAQQCPEALPMIMKVAVELEDLKMLDLALATGGDVNAKVWIKNEGDSPLSFVARSAAMIDALVSRGIDLEARSDGVSTAFQYFLRGDRNIVSDELILSLINNGADVFAKNARDARTPMQMAGKWPEEVRRAIKAKSVERDMKRSVAGPLLGADFGEPPVCAQPKKAKSLIL